MKLALLLRFVWQDLFHDRLRSLLSLLMLAVLVTLFLLVTGLAQALQDFGTEATASASNLWILSSNVIDPMDSSLRLETLSQAARDVREAFGPATVRATSPVIFRYLRISDRLMQVLAMPADDLEKVHNLELLDGAWPQGDYQAAVSWGAAAMLNARIGDPVEIYGKSFTMSGIYEAPSTQAVSIGIDYSDGERLFGSEQGFQVGVLQLDPQADLPSIQAWLEATPNLAGKFAVYQEVQFTARLTQLIRGTAVLGRLFQAMSLLVILFGSFNVASLFVLERQKEVNILYAIGFRVVSVRAVVLSRTLLLSLLAYLPGWAAASLLLQPHQGGTVILSSWVVPTLSTASSTSGVVLVALAAGFGAWLAARQPVEVS